MHQETNQYHPISSNIARYRSSRTDGVAQTKSGLLTPENPTAKAQKAHFFSRPPPRSQTKIVIFRLLLFFSCCETRISNLFLTSNVDGSFLSIISEKGTEKRYDSRSTCTRGCTSIMRILINPTFPLPTTTTTQPHAA